MLNKKELTLNNKVVQYSGISKLGLIKVNHKGKNKLKLKMEMRGEEAVLALGDE